MAARRYVHRHLDSVALLKTLGATRGFHADGEPGAAHDRGLASRHRSARCWASARRPGWSRRSRGCCAATCRRPGLRRSASGFLTAIAVLGGFALPPLLQLSRTPALRVLRRDVGPPQPLVILAFGPAVLAIAFLIYWVLRDQRTVDRLRRSACRRSSLVVAARRLAARQANYPLARRRRRVLALWHRQPRPAAHRERGAAHGVRARHHDAAAARRGPQRPAQRLAAQPARRHAQLLLHQHSAGRAPGSSPRSSKSAARSTRGRGPWFARA